MKKFSFFNTIACILCFATITLLFTSCEKEEDPIVPSPPEVPAILEVGDGHRVSYHTFAKGFQVYVCTETSPCVYTWVFKEPVATLYSDAAYQKEVGTHYAGPTWEGNDGSTVIAAKIEGVAVDPEAIPWLLLGTVSAEGPGVFDQTTYIHRVNTFGGKAPSTGADATNVGDQIQIPYTAEYFFYRTK
jgi:hypothetical protein